MLSRKRNLLGQVIGQDIQEVAVAIAVQAGGVLELCFLVAGGGGGVGRDGEFEVEGCTGKRYQYVCDLVVLTTGKGG